MSRQLRLCILVLCVLAIPAVSRAQYFGQNKVQYRKLDFKVLQTAHFDIYFYPSEQEAVFQAARMAEQWYARLSKLFDHALSGRQPLVLYASHPDFTQTTVVEDSPGEGTGGFTEGGKNRVVLPFTASLSETNHVLGHELVHAFQYDLAKAGHNDGILLMPLWFIEGMAEYVSLGQNDPLTAMWMRDAVVQDKLPTLKNLESPKFFPYRYGDAFWRYLASRFGADVVPRLLKARQDNVRARLKAITGIEPDQLIKDWHAALRATYPPPTEPAVQARAAGVSPAGRPGDARAAADSAGVRHIITSKTSGHLNVAPALSPDGRQLMFLSEKDQLSVDLFVADARTGTITRKILSTATDPHFDSLQFIDSAGAWDPTGAFFAFTAVRNGGAVLVVIDAKTGRTVREAPLGDIGQAFNATWSPDGRQVAFSGLKGGVTDLYVYDFTTGRLDALTNDLAADIQPSWSPDGRHIAFVTDRFSANLGSLQFGTYQLALIDPATKRVSPLAGLAHTRNLDPHWSPDGRSLYFLAAPNDVTNIFRLDVATGAVAQVTDLWNGVSGVTTMSPVLSVAADRQEIVFSVFTAGGYEIDAIDGRERLLGRTLATVETDPPAAQGPDTVPPLGIAERPGARSGSGAIRPASPPDAPAHALDHQATPDPISSSTAPRTSGRDTPPAAASAALSSGSTTVAASPGGDAGTTAGNPVTGIADAVVKRYRKALALEQIGTPYFSAGSSVLGTFVQAGMGFSFSDMLRDRQLDVAFQVGRHREDFAGRAVYVNRSSRWNYGLALDYLPVLIPDSQTTALGTETATQHTDYLRQIHVGGTGLLMYPFNRAQRLEFGAGVQRITFARQVQQDVFSMATGKLVSHDRTTLPAGNAIAFVETSAALVQDTAVFGATSPILGSRYRFEVAPAFGNLSFTTVVADYRRYEMPLRPFTIAMRARYVGRFGHDSSDPRLLPLVWSLRDQVRGYDLQSVTARPCAAGADTSCVALDLLNGSRLLVGNLEVRFPLFGWLNRSFSYGKLPMEGFVFLDGGSLWTRTGADATGPWSRNLLRSAGAGLRVNAGGMIFEVAAVRAYDRPDRRGWTVSFNVGPGF